jgi:hypothetical protein
MAFQLPKLTTVIDCGPIGYPGLEVKFWLNLTYQDWAPPPDPLPWETQYFTALARMIESITFPAEMTNTGGPEVYDIGGPQELWNLWNTEGFDQQIILWAVSQYQKLRQDRLNVEAKN